MKNSLLADPAKLGGALCQRPTAIVNSLGAIPRVQTGQVLKSLSWVAAAVLCFSALSAPAATTPGASVGLQWDPNPETNITGYRLSYGTTSGLYPTSINVGTTPTALVTGLAEGTTYYFVVSAINQAGLMSQPSSEVSHQVDSVNDAPVANAGSVTTAEDTPVAVVISGTDSDGDALTYSVITGPAKGILSGTAPNLTYTPAANVNGSDSFTFVVNDGVLDSTIATVSITITAANDAPVAIADSVTTLEDTPVAVFLAGTDVEGSALTYSIVNSPSKGILSGTPPNLIYTPSANANGADSFTFRVNDGTLNSATATVSISITPVNDAPVALAKSISTAEDTPVAVVLSGTDPEGSALTYTVVTGPTGGILSGTPPNLTYTPAANLHGSDSFTFRVSDGALNSANATVSITITPVNDAPVALASSVTTLEDTPVAVVLSGTDVESSPLTYAVVAGPAKGTLSGTPPNLTYTPTPNANGSDSFTFRVNDGTANSAPATVSLAITPVNDAPVALANSISTSKNISVPLVLAGTDPDGDLLTYTVVSGPANGSFSGTAPNLTYTPTTDYVGSDSLIFRVNDGTVNSASATVAITVTPSNSTPVAHANSLTTAEDTPLAVVLTGSDADGNSLTYAVLSQPAKGTLSGTAPNLTFTPTANANGSDSFTFRVNDGFVNSATATVSISITPVNDPPVAAAKSVTTQEDTPVAVILSGTDVESSPLSYVVVTPPTKGTLSGTAPNLTFTPAANANGSDSFTYRVNDGSLNSANATVSITITPVNDAPVAAAVSVTTLEDTPVAVALSGSDVEGSPLTFAIVANPTKGTLSGTPPNLTYIPTGNANGSDSFTYRVNDGTMNSATATVSITITPVNDAPVAVAFSATTLEDTPVAVVLSGSDVEGSALTFSVFANPTKGTLSGTAPNLTYIPTANANGSDSFTYRVNDGTINSANATVSITITPVNDAPVAATLAFTTLEDTPLAVLLSGSDAESSPLTYTVLTQPSKGTLSGTAPNLTYLPTANANGSDSFTYRVNDGTVNSATATVSITITPVNDLPVANPRSVTTKEDVAVTIVLTGSDADGTPLTYAIVNSPLNGTLSGTPPNVTYRPNSKFTGADQFTFRANDGTANSPTAAVSITVTPLTPLEKNTAPAFAKSLTNSSATEDEPFSGQLIASDPDVGDILTFRKVSGPAWLSVTADGVMGGTPSNSDVGVSTFTVSVSDTLNVTATAILNITVSNTNDAPVFVLNPIVLATGLEKTNYAGQTLASTATDPDVGDRISYSKISGPAWLEIASNGDLGGTPPVGSSGANLFTVRVTDAAGAFAHSILEIEINANSLPLPWTQQNVGTGNLLGEAAFKAGTFTLVGAGKLSSKTDSANFGYQSLNGDGQITARIGKVGDTGNATAAGIMIRASLAPNSRHTFLGVDADGDVRWIRRTNTGKAAAAKTTKAIPTTKKAKKAGKAAKSWVRLVRKGDVVTAFSSQDGSKWTQVGKAGLKLPKNCYIGLAVSSGSDNKLNTAKFSNVRVVK